MTHVHQGRNRDDGSPGTAALPAGRRAAIAAACLLAALALGFACPLVIPPLLAGDGGEYLLMLEAWCGHASPDLRPADIEALDRIMTNQSPYSMPGNPWSGFSESRNGLWYSMHFWLYPLLGVPIKFLLRHTGGNEFATLQVLNVICFTSAVCFAFFHGNPRRSRRLLFLVLSTVGPVIWFLRWPHPEVFTWCCTLVSLALLTRERYGMAAAVAAVGSLQNPPLILLALLPTALTLVRRQWRRAVPAAAGILPAFLAPLFYGIHFGTPSLIAASGGVKWAYISLGRSWSFCADLNQGMLPYVPAVVLFGLGGMTLALVRRRLPGIGVTAVLIGIILTIQVAPNWNNGTVGMIRYGVWIVPLFAWLATEHLSLKQRPLKIILVVCLMLQAGMVAMKSSAPDNLSQRRWARAVLNTFPRCYNPEPEIFVERQLGTEYPVLDSLPVGYIADDGSITKVLSERRSVEQFAHRFGLEGTLVPGMIRLRHPRDLVYLHLPRGAVKVVEPVEWGKQALESGIHWEVVNLSGALLDPELRFHLELTNTARYRFWGESSGARHPLTFVCSIFEGGDRIGIKTIHAPFSLAPGETILLPVRAQIPKRRGIFRVELQAALKRLVWDKRQASIVVEVLGADEKSYLAKIISENIPDDDSSPGRDNDSPVYR